MNLTSSPLHTGYPQAAVKRKPLLRFAPLMLAGSMLMASHGALALTAKLGTSLPETHPQTLGAKKFAELVKEKTHGEITIQVFPNAMLGNDVSMTSMAQAGTLEFTVPSTATLASLNDNFSIVSLPFQFDSEQQADKVLDGPAGKMLLDSLKAKQLDALDFWENGFRHITNSRRPITTLEDLQGLKVRTMQNNLYIDLFNDLKANAVPMPVNELFTALETGAVDGQENPYTVIYAQHFSDVQKYLSKTAHAYDALVLLASDNFMKQLTDAQRQAIHEAADEATVYERQTSRELNSKLLDELKQTMTINDVPASERQRMRDALQPLTKRYTERLDPAVVSAFEQALASSRQQ